MLKNKQTLFQMCSNTQQHLLRTRGMSQMLGATETPLDFVGVSHCYTLTIAAISMFSHKP
jgi:hypothetical protein